MTSSNHSQQQKNLLRRIHQHRYHHRMQHHRTNAPPSSNILRPIINNNDNSSSSMVDMNNNNANNINHNSEMLNRMAILKAFGPQQPLTMNSPQCNNNNRSKFEKPTSAREARRLQRLQRCLTSSSSSDNKTMTYDPAITEEFIRLRDSVPSIAGRQNVSDLTIINEAISLICDLESQLLHKLRCQLPDLREQFLK